MAHLAPVALADVQEADIRERFQHWAGHTMLRIEEPVDVDE